MLMKVPQGVVSVSFQGKEYKVNKNSLVKVPDAAALDLLAHGLTPAGAPENDEAPNAGE